MLELSAGVGCDVCSRMVVMVLDVSVMDVSSVGDVSSDVGCVGWLVLHHTSTASSPGYRSP